MTPCGPRHRLLRDGTAASHRQLEAHPWLRSLLTPQLSRTQYVAVLAAFLAWYRGLERWLPLVAGSQLAERSAPRWRYRSRLPALQRDLQVLGAELGPFPVSNVSSESDVSAVLGVLYVVEGSALGGRVIANRVRAALGPDVPVGHLLPADGDSWLAFVEMLESHCGAFDPECAVEAACRTFDDLSQHFDVCMGVRASEC